MAIQSENLVVITTYWETTTIKVKGHKVNTLLSISPILDMQEQRVVEQ